MPAPIIISAMFIAGVCIGPPAIRKANQSFKKLYSSISIKLFHKQFIKKTRNSNCEENDCIICLDNYSDNHKCSELHCGHKFHKTCILKWMNERKTCPLCNTGFLLKSGKTYGEKEEEYDSFYSQFEDN